MKKKIHIILLGIIIVLLVIGMYVSNGYQSNTYTHEHYSTPNWTLTVDETGFAEEISFPYSFDFDGNCQYALTRKVDYQPNNNHSPYLFVSMNHCYFKVLIDEEEIYSYTEENTPNYSKSPGNVYTAVALPQDYIGKTMRIEFTPTLESGLTYVLGDIFVSDYPSEMRSMFVNDLFHNSLVFTIFLIGIVLLVVGLFVLKATVHYDAIFIGFFALLVGLYGLTESMFNLHMLANPYFSYLINFVVFAAIPIPVLAFYRSKIAPCFTKFYTVGLVFAFVNVFMQLVLHFTKVADLRQTLICTHIVYALTFLLVILSTVVSPKEKCADKRLLVSLIIPIVAGGMIDALLHYAFIGMSERNTGFSQVGVLISLLIASGYLTKSILCTYQEHLNAQAYKLLAFKDGLTSLYNRTAYNEEVELLSQNPKDNEDLICICADINGLKGINDSGGHLAGDQAIQEVADILNSTFAKYGKVFRIGGDEFTAFLYNLKEDTLQDILKSMYDEVQQRSELYPFELSFSLGYELLENVQNRDIEECFRRADQKMYKEKEKIKMLKK